MYDCHFLSLSSDSRANCTRYLRRRYTYTGVPFWVVGVSVAAAVGFFLMACLVGCLLGRRLSPEEKEMREFAKDAQRQVEESCEVEAQQDEPITHRQPPPTVCEQITLFEHDDGYYSEYEYTLNFKKEEGRNIAWKISGEGKVKSSFDYKTDKWPSTDPFSIKGKLSPSGKAYWTEFSGIFTKTDNLWGATWFGSFDFDTSFFEGTLMCSSGSVQKGTLKSMDIESIEEWKAMRRIERNSQAGI